jgi:hypothetical protein
VVERALDAPNSLTLTEVVYDGPGGGRVVKLETVIAEIL